LRPPENVHSRRFRRKAREPFEMPVSVQLDREHLALQAHALRSDCLNIRGDSWRFEAIRGEKWRFDNKGICA
jgi:hypothetical protein